MLTGPSSYSACRHGRWGPMLALFRLFQVVLLCRLLGLSEALTSHPLSCPSKSIDTEASPIENTAGFCFALHCQVDVQQCILLFLCRQHGQNESLLCHLPSTRPRLHPPTLLLDHTLCLHSSSGSGQAQSQRAQSYARLAAAGFHPLPSNLRWSTRLLEHNPCRVQIRSRKTLCFFWTADWRGV